MRAGGAPQTAAVRRSNSKCMMCKEVVGGGADHHTRGACAPKTADVPSLGEDFGPHLFPLFWRYC